MSKNTLSKRMISRSTKWETLWTVDPLQIKAEGLTSVIPWGCNLCGNWPTPREHQYNVLWIAWSPERGLLAQVTHWNSLVEKPRYKESAWKTVDPFEDMSQEFKSNWNPLPALTSSLDHLEKSKIDQMYTDKTLEIHAKFLSALPKDLVETCCRFQYMYIGSIINQNWRLTANHSTNNVFLKCLAILAGNNPTNAFTRSQSSLRRIQFLNSHPIIGSHWIQNVKEQSFRTIDNGVPSIPYLSNHYQCSENVVRLMMNVQKDSQLQALKCFIQEHKTFYYLVDSMPTSWQKELQTVSPQGWEYILDLINLIKDMPKPLIATIANSLRPGVGGEKILELNEQSPLAHFNDTATAMARELFLPALARTDSRASLDRWVIQTSKRALLSVGLPRLTEAVRAHLNNLFHGAALGMNAQLGMEWPQAAPPVVAPSGLHMRFLTSQRELDYEGQYMRHCVGSYGRQCLRRQCVILSIGEWELDGSWKPRSTVEIIAGINSTKEIIVPQIQQHYGPRNSPPSHQEVQAINWWMQECSTSKITIHPEALVYRDASSYWDYDGAVAAQDLEWILGDGWNTPEGCAHRWDRWKRILNTRQPRFGDWLVSLPTDFFDDHGSRLAESVLDLETSMELELQIIQAEEDNEPIEHEDFSLAPRI